MCYQGKNQKLALYFNESENYFIIDSRPKKVCKLLYAKRSNICKETTYSYPNKDFILRKTYDIMLYSFRK